MSLLLKSTGHHCFACREPVNDRDCLQIIDRLCHLHCFKCQTCSQNLNSNMFCVALGDLYCEKHYMESFSANGHSGISHDNSSMCNGRFYGGPQGKTKANCFICGLPVDEPEPLSGPSGSFHGGCFRCHRCRRMLNVDKYRVIRGKLCCEPECEEPASRPDPVAERNNQNNGYWGAPRLHRNVSSPVSPIATATDNCFNCGLSVKPKDRLWVMDRVYHRDCFRCQRCDIVLSSDKYNIENEKPCCQPACIDQLEQRSIKISTAVNSNGKPYVSYPTKAGDYPDNTKTPIKRYSEMLGKKLGETAAGTQIFRGDVEKIAKIHRRLEEIQASEAEEVKCYACGRRVYAAERLPILNRIYHPQCFRCDTCERVLNGGRYSIHEGKAYCIPHHRQLINLKSASVLNLSNEADKPSKKEYISKPELPKIQTATPIVQNEDEIFQEPKPEEPKCYECGIKVYPAEQLNILNRVYHRTCFKCKTCQNVLDLGRYGVHNGVPYCNAHHRQAMNLGSLSSINVTAPSTKTPATPQQKRMALHVENETIKCFECDQKVYPAEQLNMLKRVYHRSCFKCKTCNKVLNVGRYGVFNGNPYCNPHHRQVINLTSTSMSNLNVAADTINRMESTSDVAPVSESSALNPPFEKRIQKTSEHRKSLSKTRCFHCGDMTHPGTAVILLDRVYHVECLKCRICQRQLSRWSYKELDGLIYCSRDYTELLATRAKTSASQTKRTLFV